MEPIVISVKKQNNRFITTISNIESYYIDPKSFSEACKLRFASSSHVITTKDGNDVVVQGNVVYPISQVLKEYGLLDMEWNNKKSPIHPFVKVL